MKMRNRRRNYNQHVVFIVPYRSDWYLLFPDRVTHLRDTTNYTRRSSDRDRNRVMLQSYSSGALASSLILKIKAGATTSYYLQP